MGYDEQLRSLPVPMLEQTAQFAEHVADNHSWYKHLPFFPPGASFVFFPNAHAGRGVKSEQLGSMLSLPCSDLAKVLRKLRTTSNG